MLPPVFVRANLAFGLEEQSLEFRNSRISIFGVTGLKWEPLSPSVHFGQEVSLSIRTLTPEPVNLLVPAQLMRETSPQAQFMGLRLRLVGQERAILADQVK